MKKKSPASLFEKVNGIWKVVSEIPGLLKGLRREMRRLHHRVDELEGSVRDLIIESKEQRLAEPPPELSPPLVPASPPWVVPNQSPHVSMYGPTTVTTTPGTGTWSGTTITLDNTKNANSSWWTLKADTQSED